MADFNLAYAPVAKWEGGWTHDSGDKGQGRRSAVRPQLLPQRTDLAVIDRERAIPPTEG